MKKILSFLVLTPILWVSSVTGSFGQMAFEYHNAIKISPVPFGQSQFEFSYEKFLKNRKSSLYIAPSIFLKDNGFERIEGFQGMAQMRFFLNQLNNNGEGIWLFHNIGFYTGPYALGLTYTEDYLFGYYHMQTNEWIEAEFTKDLTSFEGGVILGAQIDITKRILLDLYVGGGVRYSDFTDTIEDVDTIDYYYGSYGVFDIEYTGVKPKLGLQLGFTF